MSLPEGLNSVQVHKVDTMQLHSRASTNACHDIWSPSLCTQWEILMRVWGKHEKDLGVAWAEQTICSGINKKTFTIMESQLPAEIYETSETSLSGNKRWSWGQRGTLRARFQGTHQCLMAPLFHFIRCYIKCLHFPISLPLLELHTAPWTTPTPSKDRWADPPAEGSGPSWGCWTLNCRCCCESDHLKCARKGERERKKRGERWT